MSSINVFDIIILVILFGSMILGFGRGLVSELISLATLIAALVIATVFANPLATAFTSSSSVQNAVSQASTTAGVSAAQPVSYVAIGISFALLFAGVLLIGAIIGYIVNAAFQIGLMGLGNRLLGALFGLVRGFFLSVVLIFLVQLAQPDSEWLQNSKLVPMFQPPVQWLESMVSPTLEKLKSKMEESMEDNNSQKHHENKSKP